MRTPSSIAALVLIATFLFAPPADACHGPGTAAGGVQVWSARPLARGAWAALLRADYTHFESFSANQIEQKTFEVSGDHAHFHVVGQSTLITLGLQYGLTDNLEIG